MLAGFEYLGSICTFNVVNKNMMNVTEVGILDVTCVFSVPSGHSGVEGGQAAEGKIPEKGEIECIEGGTWFESDVCHRGCA